MNKTDYLRFLKRNHYKTLPIFMYPIASSLGINPYDLTVDPNKHVQVMKYIDDLYDFGFIVGLMDLTLEAEAFGVKMEYDGINLPQLGSKIINNNIDAYSLAIPGYHLTRTNYYMDTLRKASSVFKDKPILASVIGPFSLASILLGIEEVLEYVNTNPEILNVTLDKVCSFLKVYYNDLIEAGAHGLFICEPMAGLLSMENCQMFSTKYFNDLVDNLPKHAYIVYHNCGDAEKLIYSLKQVECDIYHFGDKSNILNLLDNLPNKKLIMGNISPIALFRDSSPKKVEKATISLLKKANKYDNFLISPGCDIPANVDKETIIGYLKGIDKFFKR